MSMSGRPLPERSSFPAQQAATARPCPVSVDLRVLDTGINEVLGCVGSWWLAAVTLQGFTPRSSVVRRCCVGSVCSSVPGHLGCLRLWLL